MMHWMLTPYDKHSDDGFGAMAHAFQASAEALMAAERDSIAQRELPICFLLRHAAELYIKSVLIVSHRSLAVADKSLPTVQVDGKAKPLTSIHNLGVLYRTFIDLLSSKRTELEARAKTAWLPPPPELDKAIADIDVMDQRGVFFRYPTENNSTKSNNKPMPLEDVRTWQADQQGFLKAFFIVDDNDEVVEAYRYDHNLLQAEIATLKTACEWLTCFHVGLRHELAGGW